MPQEETGEVLSDDLKFYEALGRWAEAVDAIKAHGRERDNALWGLQREIERALPGENAPEFAYEIDAKLLEQFFLKAREQNALMNAAIARANGLAADCKRPLIGRIHEKESNNFKVRFGKDSAAEFVGAARLSHLNLHLKPQADGVT